MATAKKTAAMSADTNDPADMVVCIPRAMPAGVDSIPTTCHFCGDELWISQAMTQEKPDALHCCFPCVAAQLPGQEVRGCITESTQEALRALGMTDEQIAATKDKADALLNLLSWMQS